MTQYISSPVKGSPYRKQVQEAKAKRQAVLQRVRKQRAQTYKRMPARESLEEMRLGEI
jgi:hypothetical protein